MKQVTIDEISENFANFLEIVQNGEDILVTGEEGRKKIAVILSYQKFHPKPERTLAPLKGKAKFKTLGDFKMSDEEVLSS